MLFRSEARRGVLLHHLDELLQLALAGFRGRWHPPQPLRQARRDAADQRQQRPGEDADEAGQGQPDALDALARAPVERWVVTNTIPLPSDAHLPTLQVISVAPLLAESIRRIHENLSVSGLFD